MNAPHKSESPAATGLNAKQNTDSNHCIVLTPLELDDMFAIYPDLRRATERAYRKGHVEGWCEAVDALFDYGGDGAVIPAKLSIDTDGTFIPADSDDDMVISPDQINQFSHLLCAWQDGLDDEPVPPHGNEWEPPPRLQNVIGQWRDSGEARE